MKRAVSRLTGVVAVVLMAAPGAGASSTAAQAYRLGAADGGVFAFNTAYQGGMAGQRLAAPVVDIASDPQGAGYWLVPETVVSSRSAAPGSTGRHAHRHETSSGSSRTRTEAATGP